MIDMKISEMEKKESHEVSVINDTSNYPYCLKLYLDPEVLKKLGIGMVQVGEKFKMEAMVEVVSVSAENYKGDAKEISASLQIKEMSLEKKSESVSAAAALYGGE